MPLSGDVQGLAPHGIAHARESAGQIVSRTVRTIRSHQRGTRASTAGAERRVLVFRAQGRRSAIDLDPVLEVVRAVELTPVPPGSAPVIGLLNLRGRILPVLAPWMDDPETGFVIRPEHRFVILRAAGREAAILAETVEGVEVVAGTGFAEAANVPPEMAESVVGVAHVGEEVVLVHDVELLLSGPSPTATTAGPEEAVA